MRVPFARFWREVPETTRRLRWGFCSVVGTLPLRRLGFFALNCACCLHLCVQAPDGSTISMHAVDGFSPVADFVSTPVPPVKRARMVSEGRDALGTNGSTEFRLKGAMVKPMHTSRKSIYDVCTSSHCFTTNQHRFVHVTSSQSQTTNSTKTFIPPLRPPVPCCTK
ncbi:unnamed protein product [Scytosiphon promiscuus]